MLGTLSPVIHPYNHKLYRVPLRREGDSYTIFVDDCFTREFTEQTLPDEIKSKLTMVLARGGQILHDHEVTHLSLMMGFEDYELSEVGWQSSDKWFVVVLDYDSLMRLRGEQ